MVSEISSRVGMSGVTPPPQQVSRNNEFKADNREDSSAVFRQCDWLEVRFTPLEPLGGTHPGDIYGQITAAWVDFNGDQYIQPDERVRTGEPVYVGDRFTAAPGQEIAFLTKFMLSDRTQYKLELRCDGKIVYATDQLYQEHSHPDWIVGGLTFSGQ